MDDFTNTYLLNTINDYKSRRALTLAFNDGQEAILYSETLVYLTIEYLGQLKNHKDLLESHNGYMIKTFRDAEIELGLTYDRARLIFKGLEAAKLISLQKTGRDNRTSVKVDLDAVNALLNEFIPKYEALRQEYLDKQEQAKEARKERAQKHMQSKLDFDKVNQITENNKPQDIGTLSDDYDTCSLIYVVNHYYKKYTGKTFFWNAVKFNTLMTTWRNRANRKGSEFGLSYALFTELNNKGFGSQRPFELRVRETFNPDIQPKMFDSRDYTNVIFDNILQVNL